MSFYIKFEEQQFLYLYLCVPEAPYQVMVAGDLAETNFEFRRNALSSSHGATIASYFSTLQSSGQPGRQQ